jgi:hypothetical protein
MDIGTAHLPIYWQIVVRPLYKKRVCNYELTVEQRIVTSVIRICDITKKDPRLFRCWLVVHFVVVIRTELPWNKEFERQEQ